MFKSIQFYCVFFLFLLASNASAQIKYDSQVCVNDVAGFIYVPTNGKTIQSVYWEFGDGFTSNNTNSVHIYTKKGTYSVKGSITFTDASTVTETVSIDIMGLPTANFIYDNFKDSCTNSNLVCLKDLSAPDNVNQPIVKKIIAWGDGNTYNTSSPYSGQVNCNTYYKADKYKIFIEVTDNMGCVNTFKKYVTIKEGIHVNFQTSIDYTDCKTAKVCVQNYSYHSNSMRPTYKWTIDSLASDTNAYKSAQKCLTYKATKSFTITLLGTMPNGCAELATRKVEIDMRPLQKDITLSDSLICYGSGVKMINAKIDPAGLTNFSWFLDQKKLVYNNESIDLFTDDSMMVPGYHYLKCIMFRGKCSTTVTKVIHVQGPVASFEIFNFNGCVIPNKRVFFITQSTFDPKFTSFNWTLTDPNGNNCITNRTKNSNVSEYCNGAEDSFMVHRYRNVLDLSQITFTITDAKTGCSDETTQYLVNKCSRLCQPDTNDIHICLGDKIFDELADVKLPYKISFNNGLRWYNYPVSSDSIGVGMYYMSIIFKEGYKRWPELYNSGSYVIKAGYKEFLDTLRVKNRLFIHDNRKDTIEVKVYGQCSPFNATLKFKNTKFHAGEVLDIVWGDGQKSNILFVTDETVDSFTHLYNVPGLGYQITVKVSNPAKCQSGASYYIRFGKIISLVLNNAPCAKTEICFSPRIEDTKNNTFWTEKTHPNRYTWWSSNNKKKDHGFTHCETFPKGGYNDVTLSINDTDGCIDTYTQKVFIKEVKAGIKKHLHDVYCTELTQFFDSSVLIGNAGDYITSYTWDFGNKQFSVYDKDPSKAFDLPGDSLRITHVVVSNDGCTDTTTSAIKFIGANTYFRIKDTIACGRLEGVFYNFSSNCSQYIWEYGNDSNSTFNTDTKETAYKTYRKVGKYKVRLRGIQSVFNPFTNNMYYCSSIFPDQEFSKDSSRTVWVLPDGKSAILSRDTICVHDTVHFESAVDTLYKMNKWAINDSSFSITKVPYDFSHRFEKEGVYSIKLRPQTPSADPMLGCLDSAEKKVYVVKVRAGFTIDDQLVPNIQFINTSTPKYATYQWSFGDQSSGSNTSTDENPTHNYVDLTKQYQICLVATIKFGCADTICKPLGPYSSYCSVYNVFTPGNGDGMNDVYDVVIEGEATYHLTIYDRWGVVVYKADKDNDEFENNNWNGKVHNTGLECSAGTYYYVFNYSMQVKPEVNKTIEGVITLIR